MGKPGLAPAGEALVLCFAKEKYPKERRAEVVVPALRYGHTALLGLSGVWLNSLRSNNASPYPLSPPLLADATRRGIGSGHPARLRRAAGLAP